MGGWRILWCLTQISQIGIGFTQKLKTSAYVDTKTITSTCIREKQSILETMCKKAKNAINKANLNELWFWDIWLIQSSKQQTIAQKHFTRSTVFSLSKKKKKTIYTDIHKYQCWRVKRESLSVYRTPRHRCQLSDDHRAVMPPQHSRPICFSRIWYCFLTIYFTL